MCQSPKTKKLPAQVINKLEELEFKCSNKSNGCNHIASYSGVIGHYQECEFLLVSCSAHPLCDKKYLRKDISSHEKHCKYVKVDCSFCGQKDLFRCQLEKHWEQKCLNSKKCEKCNQFFSCSTPKEPKHNCIESLSHKISSVEDFYESKEVESREELRKRDLKINSLMSKQRDIWKYLVKIERSLKNNCVPNMPVSILHPHSVNEEESDK